MTQIEAIELLREESKILMQELILAGEIDQNVDPFASGRSWSGEVVFALLKPDERGLWIHYCANNFNYAPSAPERHFRRGWWLELEAPSPRTGPPVMIPYEDVEELVEDAGKYFKNGWDESAYDRASNG
jgi:hypothetical protein